MRKVSLAEGLSYLIYLPGTYLPGLTGGKGWVCYQSVPLGSVLVGGCCLMAQMDVNPEGSSQTVPRLSQHPVSGGFTDSHIDIGLALTRIIFGISRTRYVVGGSCIIMSMDYGLVEIQLCYVICTAGPDSKRSCKLSQCFLQLPRRILAWTKAIVIEVLPCS